MSDQRLRHYLEQVIVAQQMAGAFPKDAVDIAAEIENHCRAQSEGLLDPFDEFGDPEEYGKTLVKSKSGLKTMISMFSSSLIALPFVFIFLFALNLFGVESISKTVALVFVAYIVLSIVAAAVIVEFSLSKNDLESKLKISATGWLFLILACLIWVAAIVLVPADGINFDQDLWFWFVMVIGNLAVAWLSIALHSYLTKSTMPVRSASNDPVISEIIADMNTAGFIKGWVKYSPEGENLEELSLRELFGLRRRNQS